MERRWKEGGRADRNPASTWPSFVLPHPEIKLSPQDVITPSQPLQTPRFERSHGLSWAMQPGGRWDSKLWRSLIQQVMWILMWIHTGTAGAQRSVALLYCKCSEFCWEFSPLCLPRSTCSSFKTQLKLHPNLKHFAPSPGGLRCELPWAGLRHSPSCVSAIIHFHLSSAHLWSPAELDKVAISLSLAPAQVIITNNSQQSSGTYCELNGLSAASLFLGGGTQIIFLFFLKNSRSIRTCYSLGCLGYIFPGMWCLFQ